MILGKKIKNHRRNNQLSQEQLGLKVGKSIRTIQLYESGEATPTLDVLKQMSRVFGTNIFDILNETEFGKVPKRYTTTPYVYINKLNDLITLSQEFEKTNKLTTDNSISKVVALNDLLINFNKLIEKNLQVSDGLKDSTKIFKEKVNITNNLRDLLHNLISIGVNEGMELVEREFYKKRTFKK